MTSEMPDRAASQSRPMATNTAIRMTSAIAATVVRTATMMTSRM